MRFAWVATAVLAKSSDGKTAPSLYPTPTRRKKQRLLSFIAVQRSREMNPNTNQPILINDASNEKPRLILLFNNQPNIPM